MSFFRANLIGLKADRDKKEIGIVSYRIALAIVSCVSLLRTECRYLSGRLIELKCAIRGSSGSLGPREIKKKKDAFACSQF
jgi:hypothetical protein